MRKRETNSGLQIALEQTPTIRDQSPQIRDEIAHPIGIGDERSLFIQLVNIIFVIQHERSAAAIRFLRPRPERWGDQRMVRGFCSRWIRQAETPQITCMSTSRRPQTG